MTTFYRNIVAARGRIDGQPIPLGYVGEKIESKTNAFNATGGVIANALSISLTPGVWTASGLVAVVAGGTLAGVSNAVISISSTSLTHGVSGDTRMEQAGTLATSVGASIYDVYINISVATIYYLVFNVNGTGTGTAAGRITAERVA